jgi:hypothetical protein
MDLLVSVSLFFIYFKLNCYLNLFGNIEFINIQ